MSTPLETLQTIRPLYPTPMSNAQLGEMLNQVAWLHRAEGYGLLYKPAGANCPQPQTGIKVSRDILMLPDGRIYDCLIDAEGAATPTWQRKQPVNNDLWRQPVDATVTTEPEPPEVPPPSTQPYPDEPTWWAQFEHEQAALYEDAGQSLNWEAFRWSSRTGYDIGAGMDKDASKAKHLAECRAALGLP